MKPERPRYSEAPFPATYREAVVEIRRLRTALFKANENLADRAIDRHLTQKDKERK